MNLNGAKMQTLVSKQTNFLIAGEKCLYLKKAKMLGVKILSENDIVILMD